ncbi:proton-transporting V-type ATPase complex assembly regulator TMEM9-like isoform X1 [Haliotis rubra]|uniref:proton-transporting V-type ATPase complex assembly regulator TMEM9-like isoform X1 n=1 Tax=Haliotis rubra TaxID=36100 RepID=UPI001EE5E8BF|nr:proton-transporting V-type ATPase complex assembly regulator TMEM9-like isoform X1 [Haliotis rubra]
MATFPTVTGFLQFTVAIIIVLQCVSQTNASYEDARCKCVCDLERNGTKPERTVYVQTVGNQECKCDTVALPKNPEIFCPRCECSKESRNTTTIKVVVIFIICVVSLLMVYMLFLMCLDPLIARRPAHYQEHADEEVNLDDLSMPRMSPLETAAAASASTRQRSILNRVSDEQKKWKGTVKEQRKHIYDRHSMLN